MGDATMWWMLAGALIGLELLTGTFYLLMLSLGMVGGALAAHADLPVSAQLVLAALVGSGAVLLWHWQRARQPAGQPASSNKDVNLDIGASVHVAHWSPERQATVSYRGAQWAAALAASTPGQPGLHRIVQIQGSCLVLEPVIENKN